MNVNPHLGHHEIEHDELGSVLGNPIKRHPPIFGLRDHPALLLQHTPQQRPQIRLVLDHQHRAGWMGAAVFL